MPKQFYSERDIEDLVKRGVTTLEINDQVVLTDLAYEKAERLGLQLVRAQPGKLENPPGAPVRPYLPQAISRPAEPAPVQSQAPRPPAPQSEPSSMQQRIHSAVVSRLGSQIDPNLLDLIITRVMRSTGLK